MTPVIIIPARWGSSRFPGKPLTKFAGSTLIGHTLRAARRVGWPNFVATDDERIASEVERLNGVAVMTGEHKNGTERCAEAAQILGIAGPVINWQGDAPLVPPEWIVALRDSLCLGAQVATPVQRVGSLEAERIRRSIQLGVPSATTAVLDATFGALYFSKMPIPVRGPWWLHIGVYAYTAEALASYGTEEGMLEKSEQLEQLRFLERRCPITAVPVDGPPVWEVNNPEDVYTVEAMMGASQ